MSSGCRPWSFQDVDAGPLLNATGHFSDFPLLLMVSDPQVDRRSYDARARASLKRLVKSLGVISWKKVSAIESSTTEAQLRLIDDDSLVPAEVSSRKAGRYVQVRP